MFIVYKGLGMAAGGEPAVEAGRRQDRAEAVELAQGMERWHIVDEETGLVVEESS